MSWGYRIIIVFVLFFLGLGVMIFTALRQNNDMVEDNYYDRELQYQKIIDAKRNFAKFNDSLLVTSTDANVQLKLPAAAVQNVDSGKVIFMKPSNKSQDRTIILSPAPDGIQLIPKGELTPGFYLVKASWSNAGVPYFDERKVIIK